MSLESIDPFFKPSSIALIGASSRPGSIGSILVRNLMEFGRDRLFFVNPYVAEIEGLPVYPSIPDLPHGPDLAVVAVPPSAVLETMELLGLKGVRNVVVITAGLGQGPDSITASVTEIARRHDMRVIGPNSVGLQVPALSLNATFSKALGRRGDLAFISQSGTLIMTALDWGEKHKVGFSGLVSLGDACDVGFGSTLDYFATDHNTRAILLYVESIRDARAFMSAARAAARSKPVVLIKSGRHAVSARAAASHTGALAGLDAVYDCAFRRAGLLRVDDLGQMFAAAETLSLVPRINGKRIAVITNGGGVGVLAVDRIADLGGQLAQLAPETIAELDRVLPGAWSHANPVDMMGDAQADRYLATMKAVLADKGVDAIVVMNCPTALAPSRAAAEALVEAITDYKRTHFGAKPVIAAWLGADDGWEEVFNKAKIPVLETPNAAIEGLMQLVRHAEAQSALTAAPPDLLSGFSPDRKTATAVVDGALADGRDWLTAREVYDLLSAYEINTAPAVLCANPAEARREASRLFADYRSLVVKIASPDIVHKSEVGGVELELATPDAVEMAARRVIDLARDARPGARIEGVTLHPMIVAPKAVELIAGVADDPVFGPVLVFGRGGTAVEVIDDKALALPPLDMNLARDLIERTRVVRQLNGYRDRKPVDKDRLALMLVKLAQLVAEEPRIREIDLNPLIADHQRLIVVDARISVRADIALESNRIRKRIGHPRLAIRPYPTEWEQTLLLPSGRKVFMRPVRPEDEDLYLRFFERMTEEDLRLRFFARVRELGHSFVARLTQIDYARAMAFTALDPETGEMLGGVRLHGDPDHLHGEYAVAVRSDLKGIGLGWGLMRQIIRFASQEGFDQIHGEVLRENTSMLSMCQALGFEAKADVDSPEIMKVSLDVAKAVALGATSDSSRETDD
ncbi:bifunctional acetate--CoA ligase family protein/GNAT family N-acetyltransferase [Oryzibacter oryziterrae]|uniref:bifunctional acetate--CoA ligase family protein/GNAT family N-acetyltransferase n=1 Tax=Oryzibacter oryziterrae TaxID=2766474 RepID=UPI001F3A86DD|nr:bifunctional acetate--CoA ligase family protein/GNAT family N-acetyltransferase [Oryzibacter oryziterrae]